jgi:hypothetical protein
MWLIGQPVADRPTSYRPEQHAAANLAACMHQLAWPIDCQQKCDYTISFET